MNEEKNLFQIGEVTKALGITRRMLINYENLGLVKPAVRNDSSGFRYYSADEIVHIRIIRVLQNMGLSLAEIRDYFNDTTLLGEQIDRLVLMRNQLDQHIAQLRLRQAAICAEEVHHVALPAFTAFCREFHTDSLSQKTDDLRQTYVDALKVCRLDIGNKLRTRISIADRAEGMYIVPVSPESKGPDIKTFPQTGAICIYHRGPYENFPDVYNRLLRYADENGLTPQGDFIDIYMEGPPTHGTNKNAYMTQVAMPIKFIQSKSTVYKGLHRVGI